MQVISNNCPAHIQAKPEKVLENDSVNSKEADDGNQSFQELPRQLQVSSKMRQLTVGMVEQDIKVYVNSPGLAHKQVCTAFWALDIDNMTREDYYARIDRLLDFVMNEGSLNSDTFIRYKAHLKADNQITVGTKNKYLTVARILFRQLHRRGVLPVDITAGVKGFQQDKKHKKSGLDDEDIQKLQAHLVLTMSKHNGNSWWTRTAAILLLLTYHGLRQIEVCRLDVSDYDHTEKTLLVRGKGRDDKERIYIHNEVSAMLDMYLFSAKLKDGPMFISLSNSSLGKRLSTRGLHSIIKPMFEQMGIDKTIHGLRHYYITKLLEAFDGDVVKVMKYSRHRSVEMMTVYNDNLELLADKPKHDAVFDAKLIYGGVNVGN